MKKLTLKTRALKYRLERNFISESSKLETNIKLMYLYSRLGNYKKATKFAEYVCANSSDPDHNYMLYNLYVMSGEQHKAQKLESSCEDFSDNLTRSIANINKSVFNDDKVAFIRKYVESKGAHLSLIRVKNKGSRLKNKSQTEIELLNNEELYLNKRHIWSQENTPPEYIKRLYNSAQQAWIPQLYEMAKPTIKATKVVLADFHNGVSSVSNGFRTTVEQPAKPNHRVLVFGSSTTYSIGASDEDTLTSHMQKYLNVITHDVRVENHGVIGMNLLLAMNNLVQTDINPGDIVVFFDYDDLEYIKNEKVTVIDLNEIDRGDNFFIDMEKYQCHFSPQGNKVIARLISDEILPHLTCCECPKESGEDEIDLKMHQVLERFKYFLFRQTAKVLESCEMKSYLSLLEQHIPDEGVRVGSVAVNCNPITKGHLHLLEHASRSVDKLFIFVIEEDKSYFKFEDRLHLVKESTKHLDNVTVLRGGKFICTELTYPDYFNKDTTETKADASMEAWFFCEYIANKLNISKIFLGDEPNCMITKQYNEKMQELLPSYNIEVEIIDRISSNGNVISASNVRKLLKVGDFESIEAIVPKPTLRFLKENYSQKVA